MKRLILIVAVLSVSGACSRQPPRPVQAEWGQGYETQQGYMQPDHGWLYYWMMYHVFFSQSQPTYHVYMPPAGMPSTYRPWRPTSAPVPMTARPATPNVSPRTSGGFSAPAPVKPSGPPRSSGGFSAPRATPAPAPRTSGGFSSTPRSSSSGSSRTSGGFGSSSSGSRRR